MATVEEKLLKFQALYEGKLKKITSLETARTENEEALLTMKNFLPQLTETAAVNLRLAEIKLQIAKLREAQAEEETYQKQLQIEIAKAESEIEEAINLLQETTRDIPHQKARLRRQDVIVTDYVNKLEEIFLMSKEENISYLAMISDSKKINHTDQQLEWLNKLIRATKIQSQDAERRLASLQQRQLQKQQVEEYLS